MYGEAQQLQADAMTRFAETGDDEDKEAAADAKKAVKKAGAYLAHAKNLRGATHLRNMMELSKPALVLKADKLDANSLDLNTPAGIVNLTTGELRPHDRCAYCGQITEASPGEAGQKMWEDFLHTTTCGDGSVQGFLQLVSGMALATLQGKRMVVTGELEEHQRLSIATLKQVASTDKLTIEEKYKQPETVKQSHTLVLFTNHLPRVGSIDDGTWRRLLVVPSLTVFRL